MQSRRLEDDGKRSSIAARIRNPRIQIGFNPYSKPSSREVRERLSPRSRRSLSPPRRVVGGGERRGGSFEGRDFGWEAGGGTVRPARGHLRSQSPPFGRTYEMRREYDERLPSRDELRRKYEFCDVVDYKDEVDPGREHRRFRGNADRDRVLDDAGDQLLSGKPRVLERGRVNTGEYRSQAELEYASRNAEDAMHSSVSWKDLDNARSNNDRIQYPDPFLLEKLVAMENYRKEEEYATQSRDVPYYKGSASQSKYYADTSQLKEFAGTSSRSSRENMMCSFQDDMSLPLEVHSRNLSPRVGQYSFAEVHKRHRLGIRRESEADHNDLLVYKRAAFSPSMVEGPEQDYIYPRNGYGEKDDYSFASEELCGRRYHHDDVNYYQRDIMTSQVMEPNRQHTVHADYSQRRLGSSNSWDHPSSQNRSASKYLYPNRSLAAVDEQFRFRMEPKSANVQLNDRVLGEAEVPLLNISPNDGLSRRSGHGSGRDAFSVSGPKSMRISSDILYEREMQELDLRTRAIYSDELHSYDPSHRSLKRKYDIDEELNKHSTKGTSSDNMHNLNTSKDQNERSNHWDDLDAIDLLPSRSLEYNQKRYRRGGGEVDFVERGRYLESDDQYHDPMEYKQDYSSKPFRPGKGIKGQPRHGSLNSYNLQTFNKGRSFAQNVWLRGKDSKELDESVYKTQESKNCASSFESNPPDESKEFTEQVQAFFLSFSKMLNESLGTRKRYKEQGRAGSLFCIVCGKSKSKEFKDTQGLATHCYMSKKVGLRAQHLGLFKAICVLLGWNTVVGTEVITFTPQVISSPKALAQKEDLILWPPAVIIHTISTSASCPRGQKILTKEAVEDFLRGKRFSVGKIKVCPGVSANNTMVVKFLGTFPGLQDAEKLHKYFLDDKHGRTDFEQKSLIKADDNVTKERMQRDKLEEHVLYGYMAISEDLDKVDFDTKRKCSVRSKKEIEAIAEEPLK